MTEEIIIDGVNVAGCRHLSFVEEDYCCDCQYEKYASCEGYDCAYKQLKCLEQENKEFKKQIEPQTNYTVKKFYTDKEYNELKQENKKLKKDVQLFKCLDTFGESECRCACRCLGNEFCEDADKKIEKYRSALEDIREMLIICQEFRTCERCKFYKECNKDLEGCITDKINEVLTP